MTSHLENCSGCPICELIKENKELKNVLVLFEEEKDNIRVLNKNVEQNVGMHCILLALMYHQKNMQVGEGYKYDKQDFVLTIERITKDIYAVSFQP